MKEKEKTFCLNLYTNPEESWKTTCRFEIIKIQRKFSSWKKRSWTGKKKGITYSSPSEASLRKSSPQ